MRRAHFEQLSTRCAWLINWRCDHSFFSVRLFKFVVWSTGGSDGDKYKKCHWLSTHSTHLPFITPCLSAWRNCAARPAARTFYFSCAFSLSSRLSAVMRCTDALWLSHFSTVLRLTEKVEKSLLSKHHLNELLSSRRPRRCLSMREKSVMVVKWKKWKCALFHWSSSLPSSQSLSWSEGEGERE